MANNSGCKVFIGNIPYGSTEKEMTEKCEEIGPVVKFTLKFDKDDRPKGFGFCEYLNEETAASARRNLNGVVFKGRELRVDFAGKDVGAAERKVGGPPGVVDQAAQSSLSGPAAAPVMARSLGGGGGGGVVESTNSMSSTLSESELTKLAVHLATNYSREQLYSSLTSLGAMDQSLARHYVSLCPQLPLAICMAQELQNTSVQSSPSIAIPQTNTRG